MQHWLAIQRECPLCKKRGVIVSYVATRSDGAMVPIHPRVCVECWRALHEVFEHAEKDMGPDDSFKAGSVQPPHFRLVLPPPPEA